MLLATGERGAGAVWLRSMRRMRHGERLLQRRKKWRYGTAKRSSV